MEITSEVPAESAITNMVPANKNYDLETKETLPDLLLKTIQNIGSNTVTDENIAHSESGKTQDTSEKLHLQIDTPVCKNETSLTEISPVNGSCDNLMEVSNSQVNNSTQITEQGTEESEISVKEIDDRDSLSHEENIDLRIDNLLSRRFSLEDSDDEESNPFIDSMAEEGEEDTPSEGSNDIVEIGEEINTTESEYSSDGSYENDSFIDDEEEYQLLSGEEYDIFNKPKKKSRIIQLSSGSDDDVIKVINSRQQSKQPKKPRKSRIIKMLDSSDDEINCLAVASSDVTNCKTKEDKDSLGSHNNTNEISLLKDMEAVKEIPSCENEKSPVDGSCDNLMEVSNSQANNSAQVTEQGAEEVKECTKMSESETGRSEMLVRETNDNERLQENLSLEKNIDLGSSLEDSDDEKENNLFIDSMAEAGEEETPSGGNDILEIGAEINTTESEYIKNNKRDQKHIVTNQNGKGKESKVMNISKENANESNLVIVDRKKQKVSAKIQLPTAREYVNIIKTVTNNDSVNENITSENADKRLSDSIKKVVDTLYPDLKNVSEINVRLSAHFCNKSQNLKKKINAFTAVEGLQVRKEKNGTCEITTQENLKKTIQGLQVRKEKNATCEITTTQKNSKKTINKSKRHKRHKNVSLVETHLESNIIIVEPKSNIIGNEENKDRYSKKANIFMGEKMGKKRKRSKMALEKKKEESREIIFEPMFGKNKGKSKQVKKKLCDEVTGMSILTEALFNAKVKTRPLMTNEVVYEKFDKKNISFKPSHASETQHNATTKEEGATYRKRQEFKATRKNCSKDFRNSVLYDPLRIRRVNTKLLIQKKDIEA